MIELPPNPFLKLFKAHGFNENLVKLAYSESHGRISIEFRNMLTDSVGFYLFGLKSTGLTGNALAWFKAFCISCVVGFDGATVSEDELKNKSIEMYQTLRALCQKYKILSP